MVQIRFRGKDLLSIPENEMQSIRGNEISMIFQEPMTSLNPVFRVGDQIAEVLLRHKRISKKEAHLQVIELLRRVGIPSPEIRMTGLSASNERRHAPARHDSNGDSLQSRLIIADEPTTALDVTIQAQILSLLDDLRQTHGMAILLITHDLGVIAEMAEQVLVMYTGRVVEHAGVKELFENPLHPYTQGLMRSMPGRVIGRMQGQARTDPGSRSQSARAAARVQIQHKVPMVFRPLLSGGTGARWRLPEATRCAAGFISGFGDGLSVARSKELLAMSKRALAPIPKWSCSNRKPAMSDLDLRMTLEEGCACLKDRASKN